MADPEQEIKVEKTSQVNYIKRWLKFQRLHRALPMSIPFPPNTSMALDTTAYVAIIQRIEGLNRPQSPDIMLGVRIIANMFMMGDQGDRKTANKCFFGRTYESPPVEVLFMPDGVSYEHHPINIYYHSKVTGTNAPLLLIVEVQINELQGDIVLRRQTLGWIEIPAVQLTTIAQKTNLRRGSPRVLLNQNQTTFEYTQYGILYDILLSQSFQICSFLVPENILMGFADEVPGIKDNFIPVIDRGDHEVLELSNTVAVYLSNIQVLIPEQLENEVYRQVQRYRSYKFRVSEDYKGDIQITTKRLVAGYHNGWAIVNSRGLNNFVPLAESRRTITEVVDNKQYVFKVLDYQGVIDVNNISHVDSQSEYNYGVLILQVEYEATFLVQNLGKQIMQIVLGWLPVYLNDKIGMPSEQIDEELIIGPGKTCTGRPLAHFTSADLPIKVQASMNLQGVGIQNIRDIVKQPPRAQAQEPKQSAAQNAQQPNFERFNPTSKDGEMDIKAQLKLREYEIQLNKLKEENERLKRGGYGTASGLQYPSPNDDYGAKNQHARELDYLQKIDQLMEENRVNQLTHSKQFEDLEKLIKTQVAVPQIAKYGPGVPSVGPAFDGQATGMSVLYDRGDVSRYKPLEHIQFPLPQATLRNISKADTAFLLQTGIPGLLDGDPEDADLTSAELESRALKVELEDDRKDSVIIIQPIAMKIFLQDEDLSDIKSVGFTVPKTVYFTMHFFDMPQYQTPNLQLEFANDAKALLYNLRNNTPLRVLTINEQQTHNVKFTIDTSSVRYNNLHTDFVQYLYRKCLLVDVWDAESRLLFGSLKIPLRALLRQGKQQQHLLKEVDVLDVNFRRIKGSLQILLRNVGRSSISGGPDVGVKDARSMTPGVTQIAEKAGTMRRKIISEKPVTGESIHQVHQHIIDDKDPEQRIMQRIKKLKMSNLSAVQQHEFSQKLGPRKLNEVVKYKEFKKPGIVKGIVQDFLSSEKVLNSFFGRAEIVPFVFKNPHQVGATFEIQIKDPDQPYLTNSELSLISNPAEWKFWCHFKGLPEPYSYDMIKLSDIDDRKFYYFYLDALEEITLLFKFLSFRRVDVNLQFDPDAFEYAQKRGKDFIQKYIYPRHVEVKVLKRDNRNLITELRVRIEPHMQIVDHVLRYYERDNRQTKIILPPLYTFTQPPDKRPIIYVTDESVIIEWGKENNEIKLSLKVGDVCSVRQFSVLAYADPYYSELVGNWALEVHSLAGVDLEVPLGQQVMSRLALPADVTRVVKLFCSHSQVVTFPEQYNKDFTLVPGRLNLIEYFVRSVTESSIKAQINCVDSNSQDLVYSWVIKINAVPQPHSAVYEVKCIEGRESKLDMNYVNSTNYLTTFKFTTSHPQHIAIVDTKLQIGPLERGSIRLRMLAKVGVQTLEAKIFISDVEERMFDTVLLKIRYTYS